MQIEAVRAVPGVSGFYFDDQRAIKAGAPEDGFAYTGEPVTDGFDAVRQAGESLLVALELSDGSVVRGDCAAVQYSGAGGRDPLFRAQAYAPVVEDHVGEALRGRDPRAFADNVSVVEMLPRARDGSGALHTAVRYGVSQALLFGAARARRVTPTGVLADALDTTPATDPVPVFGQSGDARRRNAEKMILKGGRVLPPGLYNRE
jgi:methylaspartate ammonia-lyase